MLRRIAFALAALVASCTAAPAFAQAPVLPLSANQVEPPVRSGEVALRLRNDTDCLIGLRAKADGTVVGYAKLTPNGGTLWLHLRPDSSALEVEVLATPRFCAAKDSSAVPTVTPAGRSLALRRLGH